MIYNKIIYVKFLPFLLILSITLQIMVDFTTQDYITYYNNLANPKLSSLANQKLIEIQQSSSGWRISKQLITMKNYDMQKHGFQLLSKKLDRAYTKQMQDTWRITDFILGLPALNKTLCYCLAKLVIHLGQQKIQLGPHKNMPNIINVLSLLPQAANIISLPPQKIQNDNQKSRCKKFFFNYKSLLIQYFSTIPNEVIGCIQSYNTYHYKIQSQQLVRLLLTRPFNQVKQILQNILIEQKYQPLSNQIYNYLLNYQNSVNVSQFFVVFIAFVRTINFFTLPIQILNSILSKILKILKKQNQASIQQRANIRFITDSYELWSQLSPKLRQAFRNNQNSPQIQLIRDAFVQLWKITIQRSLLKFLPKVISPAKYQQKLSISLDDQDFQQKMQEYKDDDVDCSNKFRQNSQDLLQMAFFSFSLSQKHKNNALALAYALARSQNPLQLQLSIFVLGSIIEVPTQNSLKEINAILQQIIKNKNTQDLYIWQQLIKFLGKLGTQVVCNLTILQTALIVLKQSIFKQQLSVLACQTFNQIILTCQNSVQKAQQIPLLQQYFRVLHQSIYLQTKNTKIFEMITKSTILYLYYYRPNLNQFQNFLQVANAKIQQLENIQNKMQIVENLALSHLFVASEYSNKFTPTISLFFASFFPATIQYIKYLHPKKLSQIFRKLSIIITVSGGYNTKIWVQGILKLSSFQNVIHQKSLIINLINKLANFDQYDTSTYQQQITNLIIKAQPFVINSLQHSKLQDYKVINKCLTFYFILLTKYIKFIPNFNPDAILVYIVENILKGKVKFQMESLRTSLAIIRNVMEKGYRVQQLLQKTLQSYKQIFDSLWKSVQAILYQAYKKGGEQIFRLAFTNVLPDLTPPNPLFNAIMQGLKQSRLKQYKNLLTALK